MKIRLYTLFFQFFLFFGASTLWGNHPFAAQADTIAPVIQCPPSTVLNLHPQKCDTVWNYSVTATDDTGTPTLELLSGIPSGGIFPIGSNVTTWLAKDLAGNTATCSFTITVKNFEVSFLTCNDLYIAVLNDNCQRTLNAVDMMEAGPYGCPSTYIVELDKSAPFGNGPWVPGILGTTDVGKTFQFRVTALQTSFKCWGNVSIKDQTAPVINCKDFTLSCVVQNFTPQYLASQLGITEAAVTATDACSGNASSSLGMIDVSTVQPCSTGLTQIIRRTWTAQDLSGNTSTCLQTISVEQVKLNDVVFPTDGATSCHAPDLSLSKQGTPYVLQHGKKWESASSFCQTAFQFQDQWLESPECDGNKIVERTWLAVDFCSVEERKIVQKIKVNDLKGPTLTCPPNTTVTLATGACRGEVDLPDAVVKDDCSSLKSIEAVWQDTGATKTLQGSLGDFPGNNTADPDTAAVFGTSADFPAGTTAVTYTASDSCGNIGACSYLLTVADSIKPVAVCRPSTIVYIPAAGIKKIPASDLNLNSADNCLPLYFRSRILPSNSCQPDDGTFSDSLLLCCANIGAPLQVRLRVYDVPAPQIASPTYAEGHFSECTANVTVIDTNKLSCIPPPDISIDCDDFDPSLSSYGSILSASCNVNSITVAVNYSQFDTLCSRGTLVRTFKLFGAGGQTGECSHKVISSHSQNYYIRFPDDKLITQCDGTGVYGEPIFHNDKCELMSTSYEDALFTVVPDACYKIERLWTIINWCTYDPTKPVILIPNPNPNPVVNHVSNLPGPIVSPVTLMTDPWRATVVKINPTDQTATDYSTFWSATSNGYKYKQIIKFIDTQVPSAEFAAPSCTNQIWTTPNDAQLWNAPYWWDPSLQSQDLCEEPTDLCITATDACSGANVNIEYRLFLDLDADGIPETVVNSEQLGGQPGGLGWNNILFGNVSGGGMPRQFDFRPVTADQKWGFSIQETISGNKKTACVRFNTSSAPNTFTAPQLPHGNHKIRWFISDGCGNDNIYEYTVNVKDCKAPTVVCLNGLSVNIMPTQTITLWATDFLQYAEDNCTPTGQLKYAIRKAGTGVGFPTNPDGSPVQSVVFSCGELGTNTVEIWSIDAAGNASYCTTYIIVMDNAGHCNNNSPLTGKILTEEGEGVNNVKFKIVGSSPAVPPINFSQICTDGTGSYEINIPAFPTNGGYTITPFKDTHPLEGITTLDLVLIYKHILGIAPLGSPYKIIAGDANRSGSMSAFDIVEFRKLITGIYDELPNNDSWRFVPKNFVFPNPSNPFTPFPETINATLNTHNYDFIGIKVGDVNGSASPHFAPGGEAPQERSAGTAAFHTSDIRLKAGETHTVYFDSKENWEGFQGELHFRDDVEIVGYMPRSGVSEEHFHLFESRKGLRISCEKPGRQAFSLQLKALRDARLSELMEWSDEKIRPEAYIPSGGSLERYDIAFEFEPPAEVVLYQNRPNPASDKTTISFYLPAATRASLEVFDAEGKTLYSNTADYDKGIHRTEFEIPENIKSGILFYRLTTTGFSETKKISLF